MVAAVTVMEGPRSFFQYRHDPQAYLLPDNPLFNSGKGAVFNVDGKVSIYLFSKNVF